MGRGNRKKNKGGGNVAFSEFSAESVVEDNNEEFTQVSKVKNKNKKNATITEPPPKENITTPSYADKLIETTRNIPPLNKQIKEVKQNNQSNSINIDDKQLYVNTFINYYWNAIGRYEVLQDIVVPPESDNEDDNYDDY
jgi:hypothetical protein